MGIVTVLLPSASPDLFNIHYGAPLFGAMKNEIDRQTNKRPKEFPTHVLDVKVVHSIRWSFTQLAITETL